MPRVGKVVMSEVEGEGNCIGLAAKSSDGHISPWKFNRRECGPKDVLIKIAYAGICHSDLHQIFDEWGSAKYPMVPGHEFLGTVIKVGEEVTQFQKGDYAAIGCMVNSCGKCDRCKNDEEQYCDEGSTMTYNGTDVDGSPTYGGYSSHVVATEKFVLKLPAKLFQAGGAPLLCAGITVYSPMQFYGVNQKGMRIGVVGLGGLGHMAVQFAKSYDMHVTVLSRSDKKKEEALNNLGADEYVATSDEDQVKAKMNSFDAIIDTVSANHDITAMLGLLKVDGKMIMLGVPDKPYTIHPGSFIMKRKTIGGSLIGGIKETQDMLNFCAEHDITCMVEDVDATNVNEALERLRNGDVKFRFVINVQDSIVADQADVLKDAEA